MSLENIADYKLIIPNVYKVSEDA